MLNEIVENEKEMAEQQERCNKRWPGDEEMVEEASRLNVKMTAQRRRQGNRVATVEER
jgi:hypothetical protein